MLSSMRHSREEVIERTIREFEVLDRLIAGLSEEDWRRPLPRREGKDPWTVKDALVHITYWKADVGPVRPWPATAAWGAGPGGPRP
jgi:hypothetical protein